MAKVDIFSGFLGAGKTTLIRKLISEAYKGEKVVLIENEFGEIGIDGAFMQDAGIEVTEMNSGCICCSLVGDFGEALKKVLSTYNPDRIIIEPSGVGKLSDVTRAVEKVEDKNLVINAMTTVVDAKKAKVYMKNFGEFFNNQVETASCIILSRTDGMDAAKLDETVALLREKNPSATIITTPWPDLGGKTILDAMEKKDTLSEALKDLEEHVHHHHHHDDDDEECCCGHHHDHEHHHDEDDDDDEECCCGHHHDHEHHHDEDDDDDEECCCGHHHDHGHHHDDDDEECCCGHHHDHEHHHDEDDDDDEECCCGHHHDHDHEHEHHHHHHGHDADEVFVSWGTETPRKYTEDELKQILSELDNADKYGIVLRSKGLLDSTDGKWLYFDYVPEESNVRTGEPAVTGRICVIGSKLKEDALKELFHA